MRPRASFNYDKRFLGVLNYERKLIQGIQVSFNF